VRLKPGKRRSGSSRRWLQRQLNDPFVAEAKRAGYRSRAAFKLAQIDDRCHVLKPGAKVVDLGAAPGGWSQVAAERCGKRGQVVAIDVSPMDPIAGVTILLGDVLDEAAPERLRAALGGPADLVLSDMAAPATGHTGTDHLRVLALVEAAFDFAKSVLAPGGGFVAKVLQGGTERKLLAELKRHFGQVRHVKPAASRKDSAEIYVVATGFRMPRAPELPHKPEVS
jgi:23S rRNA (uridine2552-2'-O)-methyltransferase